MNNFNRYQPSSNVHVKEEMPPLLQAFVHWLSMFVATVVFAMLMSLLVFMVSEEGPANSQVRGELLSKKVCHSETVFCRAQQAEFSKLIEQAVLDPQATRNVLKAKVTLAQTKSFEVANQKVLSQ